MHLLRGYAILKGVQGWGIFENAPGLRHEIKIYLDAKREAVLRRRMTAPGDRGER